MRIHGKVALLMISLSGMAMAGHTLDEGVRMIDAGAVQTQKLVIKLKDGERWEAGLQDLGTQAKAGGFGRLIEGQKGPQVRRLFQRSARAYQRERLRTENASGLSRTHLENYLLMSFEKELSKEQAIARLRSIYRRPGVEFAYFEPIVADAFVMTASAQGPLLFVDESEEEGDDEAEVETPDFEHLQFYLGPAPKGVDAHYAWTLPGGAGQGIRTIDVEHGWLESHEDLGTAFWDNDFSLTRDHGSAVWGEVAARRDGKGVTGIAHRSEFGTAGTVWATSAETYELAAAELSPGDVLIIEQHQMGPDEAKFTAMEYWQANFDAIQSITDRGILVIQAAGNGDSNFDAEVYEKAFDLAHRDSGAILVGAAGSPKGEQFLERMSFSNYGSRIDAFAFGQDVVTTGYGDLFKKGAHRSYTAKFGGTSSATPIVAGTVISLSGIAKHSGRTLRPKEVRAAIRETGLVQAAHDGKAIGRFANIRDLVQHFELD